AATAAEFATPNRVEQRMVSIDVDQALATNVPERNGKKASEQDAAVGRNQEGAPPVSWIPFARRRHRRVTEQTSESRIQPVVQKPAREGARRPLFHGPRAKDAHALKERSLDRADGE